MPEMHYTVRWPDASESVCYSPSLIIQDYFQVGSDYPLPEFLSRLREATAIANDRVRAKFGFACSRASDQLLQIEARVQHYTQHQPPAADTADTARVRVLGFSTGGA